MNDTKIQVIVPTYRPDGGDFTIPLNPVEITIGQGIGINLAPDVGSNVPPTDVYIEKRTKGWTVNVSPVGDEIKVIVTVDDKGRIIITDDLGNEVYRDESSMTE